MNEDSCNHASFLVYKKIFVITFPVNCSYISNPFLVQIENVKVAELGWAKVEFVLPQ